jgi:hypothetical protein
VSRIVLCGSNHLASLRARLSKEPQPPQPPASYSPAAHPAVSPTLESTGWAWPNHRRQAATLTGATARRGSTASCTPGEARFSPHPGCRTTRGTGCRRNSKGIMLAPRGGGMPYQPLRRQESRRAAMCTCSQRDTPTPKRYISRIPAELVLTGHSIWSSSDNIDRNRHLPPRTFLSVKALPRSTPRRTIVPRWRPVVNV